MKHLLFVMILLFFCREGKAQHSVARQWNEVLLEAIRNDFARPTVHARNLFHVSAAMYDAWAAFSAENQTYLLGNELHNFQADFTGFEVTAGNVEELQHEAISYAAYRLILHRFSKSPGIRETFLLADSLFTAYGYEDDFTSLDYSSGSAAALGNYIASQYIEYGLQDGANEIENYGNVYYTPVNAPLDLSSPGNPGMSDPNRWQPLQFEKFIDQSGNEVAGGNPDFLGPEWGKVTPFSLSENDKFIRQRDGHDYVLYFDPGSPPTLDTIKGGPSSELYKWNFTLVSIWASHLDANLEATLDISPASLGNLNISSFPTDYAAYEHFYDYLRGGDPSTGHALNPVTAESYQPQIVKLGDYARVLAEFWADGPDSETPPGHWFTILNYVNDAPNLERKIGGEGEVLPALEWDVKSYFILGGAMHDVAIAAWGLKGYYDYVRPISAIRYMADRGQSTDPQLPRYHIAGLPLVEGFIELVNESDPLAGDSVEHLHKIKLKTWKGPDFIENPATDEAGVGWILAENWWPYQRPTFVTPPFAGFISGHSTYSRAAAEVLTRLTGDRFFPGGKGTFAAPANDFLVFEKGPSEDIFLEWATYQDASDQCSLSRIWGGIHPPADDIYGRLIGNKIGNQAFDFAVRYFIPASITTVKLQRRPEIKVYPNPVDAILTVSVPDLQEAFELKIIDLKGRIILKKQFKEAEAELNLQGLVAGSYLLTITTRGHTSNEMIIVK